MMVNRQARSVPVARAAGARPTAGTAGRMHHFAHRGGRAVMGAFPNRGRGAEGCRRGRYSEAQQAVPPQSVPLVHPRSLESCRWKQRRPWCWWVEAMQPPRSGAGAAAPASKAACCWSARNRYRVPPPAAVEKYLKATACPGGADPDSHRRLVRRAEDRTAARAACRDHRPPGAALQLANGETLDYSRLVLMTGARARRLPAAIGGDLPGVYRCAAWPMPTHWRRTWWRAVACSSSAAATSGWRLRPWP